MIDDDAIAIRAQADLAAIAELLAGYPPGCEVGPRAPGSITSNDTVIQKLPRDPKKRRAKLEQHLAQHRFELSRDIEEYDDLRLRGLDAVCDYDLTIAYSGEAWNACRCNMDLHDAHISYNRSIIEVLNMELARLDAALPGPVPPGFARIDVVLPAHQAFIVKKWAEAAAERLEKARIEAAKAARYDARGKVEKIKPGQRGKIE